MRKIDESMVRKAMGPSISELSELLERSRELRNKTKNAEQTYSEPKNAEKTYSEPIVSATISCSIGRFRYGFKQAVEEIAYKVGIKCKIRVYPGIFDVDYTLYLKGTMSKINLFKQYLDTLE